MIQIKFSFNGIMGTKTKKIQFCKIHEKNLDILYRIAKESVQEKKKSNLEQLVMIFSFHIAREVRNKTVEGIIQNMMLKEFSRYREIVRILKDFKKLSIEAKIDNIPKKIFTFNLNSENYV